MPGLPDGAADLVRAYCEHKTPLKFRDQTRVEMSVRGKKIEIFDCKAPYSGDPTDEWYRMRIAQIRYDEATEEWSLFCVDRNDRLWAYPDFPATKNLRKVLAEIDRDPTCIFWG